MVSLVPGKVPLPVLDFLSPLEELASPPGGSWEVEEGAEV